MREKKEKEKEEREGCREWGERTLAKEKYLISIHI